MYSDFSCRSMHEYERSLSRVHSPSRSKLYALTFALTPDGKRVAIGMVSIHSDAVEIVYISRNRGLTPVPKLPTYNHNHQLPIIATKKQSILPDTSNIMKFTATPIYRFFRRFNMLSVVTTAIIPNPAPAEEEDQEIVKDPTADDRHRLEVGEEIMKILLLE